MTDKWAAKQGIVPTDEDYEAAREEIIGLIGDKAIHATIRHRMSNAAIYQAYTTPIDALYAEWAEREALRKWAFDQLERIVNIVKGEPEPLTSHSLHDVAEQVELVVHERDALLDALNSREGQ